MEFNLTTLGILVAVWVVGYLLGLLEAAIKNGDKQEKKDDDVVLNEDGEEVEIDALASDLEPEILAIYERISGALKLRLDGEIIEYKSDITAEQRGRLLNLVVSLRPWLDGTKVEAPLAPLPAGAKIPTTPPDKEVEVSEVAQQMEYANLSMVEQIDRVLQGKLDGHPLEQRGIQLRASVSGGLLFQIGLVEYEWIEDIPDQPIQEIIREAIAEWEENATAN